MIFNPLTFGHSDAQPWASRVPGCQKLQMTLIALPMIVNLQKTVLSVFFTWKCVQRNNLLLGLLLASGILTIIIKRMPINQFMNERKRMCWRRKTESTVKKLLTYFLTSLTVSQQCFWLVESYCPSRKGYGQTTEPYLLNIWEFVYFVWVLSPPARRVVVQRRNLTCRRVPTICRTCAGFYVYRGRRYENNDIFSKMRANKTYIFAEVTSSRSLRP